MSPYYTWKKKTNKKDKNNNKNSYHQHVTVY